MKIILVAFLCGLSLQALDASPIVCIRNPCGKTNAQLEAVVVDSKVQVCTPGTMMKQDCNDCKCLDGLTWMCTRKACLPEQNEELDGVQKCTPGSTFKKECNSCFCTDNGFAACTEMECGRIPKEIDVYAPDFRCEANKSFKHPDGCNTCACTKDGKTAGCTRMFCPSKQLSAIPASIDITQKCQPGTNFKVDCNTCFCTDNGISACTMMECGQKAMDVYAPDFKCEANKSFKHPDGCNTCMCTKDGKTAGCTRMFCTSPKISVVSASTEIAPKCQPGTNFKVDCNTCFCTDNGISACTMMECGPKSIDVYAPDFRCEANHSFKHPDGCNTCKCGKDGKTAGCTKMVCPPKQINAIPASIENVRRCIPGTTFKKACNTCTCTDDGQLSVCTMMECATQTKENDIYSPDFKCDAQKSFKHPDGCNTCMCTKDGKLGGCTLMLCSPKQAIAIPTSTNEQMCQPGTTFKIDCNTCFCSDNGLAACTRKACSGLVQSVARIVERECTPGTTFKKECNTCTCTDNGISACTMMECGSQTKEVDIYAPDFRCEAGQSFKHPDGCNTCKCSKDGKTGGCTKMVCPSPALLSMTHKFEDVRNCQPGTTFKQDCNTCLCSKDGLAACTRMLCVGTEDSKPVNNNNPSAPDFVCTAGKPFKHADGCNECTCMQDGKHAACTYNLCPHVAINEAKCTVGEKILAPDGCNTCMCSEDGNLACTAMFCPPKPASLKKCTVGEKILAPDGCNTCICGENGNLACTTMFCPEKKAVTSDPSDPNFRCTPGQSFKHSDGCNDCICADNGKLAACTLELCPPKNSQVKSLTTVMKNPAEPNFRCTPGEKFLLTDGCNTCLCSQDGLNAACTLKFCVPEKIAVAKSNENIDVLPNYDTSAPGFKCTPGLLFRDRCNMCRCTETGLPACTDQLCPNY